MAFALVNAEAWTNTGETETGSRQLSWPVASLSKHVLEAVPLLHSFQTALGNAYGLSSTRVEYFKVQKIRLRQEWEHWVALLERCFGYSRHLLQYSYSLTSTTTLSGTTVSVGALMNGAAVVCDEASQVLKTYEAFYNAFERSWAVITPSKVDQGLPQGTDNIRLIAHTLPSVHIPLSESLLALRMPISDLKQISHFWSEHCTALKNLLSEISSLRQYPTTEMTVWVMNHDSTRQSISDITASCDAISVIRTSPSTWSLMRTIWNRFRRQAVLVVIKGSPISQFSALTPEASQTTEEGFKVLTSTNHFNVRSLMSASHKARRVFETLKAIEYDTAMTEVGGDEETKLMIDLADHCCSFYSNAMKMVGVENSENIMKVIQSMSSDATAVVRLHQQVMEEHDTRLTQLRRNNSGIEEAQPPRTTAFIRKVSTLLPQNRPLRRAETTLQNLEETLLSFDNFWFSMLGATAFLQSQEQIHIPDATRAYKSWKKQEASYRRYLNKVKNDGKFPQQRRSNSSRTVDSSVSPGPGEEGYKVLHV